MIQRCRPVLVAALLLVCGDLRAEPSQAQKHGFAPKFIIYNAKGPPDSCGPGCDRWIAAEGQVDTEAAGRVRRFLSTVKDPKRPIYFHSPGGVVEPSYVIGRLLRSRKALARVGKTIATACTAEGQADAACLKIKTGGAEVEAQLSTRNAMCNSACSYLFIGAVTREVAPDAIVGVHSSRLKVTIHGNPPQGVLSEFRQRRIATADRERTAFVVSMGISRELDDLIKTVKFESIHPLTRTELYRFGIDTRSRIEAPWALESGHRASLFKSAQVKKEESSDFRTVGWRLACDIGDRARLTWLRPIEQNSGRVGSVTLHLDPETRAAFDGTPGRSSGYEFWNVSLSRDALKAMFAVPRVKLEESIAVADGKTAKAALEFDTGGLEDGWKKLASSCGVPPAINPSHTYSYTTAMPRNQEKVTPPEPGGVWPEVKADPMALKNKPAP